jgi:2-dehydropantoate 2-reductase
VERLIGAWKAYGIEAIHADDIYIALWTKFLFIASLGGVSSLARANAGEIRRCAKTYKLLEGAMLEVEGLARHQGIALAEEAVPAAMALVEGLEPNATSSMQRDVEAGGQFELEAFSGTIVRLGGKFGIATPIHSAIYALLEPALERAQAKTQ